MTREEKLKRLEELHEYYERLVDLYEDMSGNRTDIIMNTYIIRTTEANHLFHTDKEFINAMLDELKELFNY